MAYEEDEFPMDFDYYAAASTPQTTIEALYDQYSRYRGWKPWFNPIDAEVVRELGSCNYCGGKLAFQGFISPSGKTRIAICYCIKCRNAEEF
jgi:hypothetical protein